MTWQNPKTDWVTNSKNPMAEDFNRIEGNVDFLKTDIETKKGAIVDALNTVGLASELADTHATLASRITGANQGTKIITPGTTNQTIAKGFHSGSGYVKGDANLVAGNIRQGVSILEVPGTFVFDLSPGSLVLGQVVEKIAFIGTTYTKKVEARINYSGTVRVTFSIENYHYNHTGYGRIYVNGSARGVPRTVVGWPPVAFTEDIIVNAFDLIQIYVKGQSDSDGAVALSNFKVSATRPPICEITLKG